MNIKYRSDDEPTIRYFALKTARDNGCIYSADLCRRYGMPKVNAASHMIRMRELGYLVEDGCGRNGRIRHVITESGMDYLDNPPMPCNGSARRFDFKALCAATGIGMTMKKSAQPRA